jgi:hypothetical protein
MFSHIFYSVADPDSGSGVFFSPDQGSGLEKNQGPESGMNIPDHFSESLETVFRVKTTKIL